MERLQAKLESVTTRWWFFLIVVLVQFFPPIASFRYDPAQTSQVIGEILRHAYANGPDWQRLYPALNSIAILMLAGVFLLKNRWGRVFAAYAGLSYVLFALIQNTAELPGRGHGIVTNNVIMFLLVALAWFLEAGVRRTDFEAASFRLSRTWIVPLAALAFWYPVDLKTMAPDFSPMHVFTSPTGVAFCLMTPVFLALLILCYPRTNVVTLRVTGVFGVIIALYNLLFALMYPQVLWWNGVLHLPLFLISLYATILGYRKGERGKKEEGRPQDS